MSKQSSSLLTWPFLLSLFIAIGVAKPLGNAASQWILQKNQNAQLNKPKSIALNECKSDGIAEKECSCMFDIFMKKYSADQLKDMLEKAQTGTIPQELLDARVACKPLPSDNSTSKQIIKIINDQKTNKVNNDEMTVSNYKLDASKGKEMSDLLLNAVYNNPTGTCSKIVDTKDSRQHTYYLYEDFYNNLLSKYGNYRSTISYIDFNLNGLYGVIQKIKDNCQLAGYVIN